MKAILFDMDGVILDSEDLHHKCDNIVLARYGVIQNKTLRNQLIGKPLYYGINKFIPKLKHKSLEIFEEKWEELFKRKDEIQIIKPTYDFIKNNHNIISCVLVTSTPRKHTQHLLKIFNLENTFKAIVTLDDVENAKPAPDPYILALKKSSINHTEAITVEDSIAGIKSSMAAKIKTVGLIGTYKKEDINFADLTVNQITKETLKPLLGNIEELL